MRMIKKYKIIMFCKEILHWLHCPTQNKMWEKYVEGLKLADRDLVERTMFMSLITRQSVLNFSAATWSFTSK